MLNITCILDMFNTYAQHMCSLYVFNSCAFFCVVKHVLNMCLTHVDIFPVYKKRRKKTSRCSCFQLFCIVTNIYCLI